VVHAGAFETVDVRGDVSEGVLEGGDVRLGGRGVETNV